MKTFEEWELFTAGFNDSHLSVARRAWNASADNAQAEIAKRDAQIASLTAAGAEYQRQCFEQADEISRLKGVIANASNRAISQEERACRAEDALIDLVNQIRKTEPTDDHGHNFIMNMAYIKAVEVLDREALAAIKEEGL